MNHWIYWAFRHPALVFLGTLLLSIGSIPLLQNIKTELGSDNLYVQDGEDYQDYLQARSRYGSDLSIVIFAEDPQLFTASKLERLREIERTLAVHPAFEGSESLFTSASLGNEDGFLQSAPILESFPSDADALEKRKARALEDPFARGNLISADGQAMLIRLFLDPEYVKTINWENLDAQLNAVLAPHRDAFGALYHLGTPRLQSYLKAQLTKDLSYILPLAIFFILAFIAWIQRFPMAGIIPLVNAVIATLWTFAVMSILGIPITLLNYILPVLILAVGATEDVHFLQEFRTQMQTGVTPGEAIEKAAKKVRLALCLTVLTTFLGFATISLSQLPILHQFGQAAAFAVVIRFILTMTFTPALISFRMRVFKRPIPNAPEADSRMHLFVNRTLDFILPKSGKFVVLIIILAIGSLFLAQFIKRDNHLIGFLKQDTPIVMEWEHVGNKFSGQTSLYLLLEGIPGTFKNPNALKQLDQIENDLMALPEMDSVFGLHTVLSRVFGVLRGIDDNRRIYPDSSSGVEQILLFSPEESISRFASPDFSEAHLIIRTQVVDGQELRILSSKIKEAIRNSARGLNVTLTGNPLLVANAVESITEAQASTLGGMTFILFCIVAGLFLSLRCGFLILASNLLAIVLIFGVMGLTGISLNIGTCMVAAITLGIIVDDSLHILVRYQEDAKRLKSEHAGIRHALMAEFQPVVTTSLALAAGFGTLGLSSFKPVSDFGILSALVILIALFIDLIVTPVFFSQVRIVTIWDVIGLHLRKAIIDKSPFFRGLTAWQSKKVILMADMEKFSEGSMIMKRGDFGDCMYVVLAGELEISHSDGKTKTVLRKLGMGEILGEVALVGSGNRTADVMALSKVQLLRIDQEALERLRRFSPYLSSRLFLNISRILGNRLAETNTLASTRAPFPRFEEDR